MKRWKGILSIVLAAVLCLGITLSATAANKSSTDVPVQEDAYNAYMKLTEEFNNEKVERSSVNEYPEYYGGSYINDEGKLVICVPETTPSAYVADMPELEADSYVIEPVTYSYNTLNEVMDRLNYYFLNVNDDVSKNINMFGLYDKENRIIVSLFDASPEKISEFKEVVSDSPAIVFEEKENVIKTQASVNPGNMLRNGNYRASMGYRAQRNGVNGFVTSAHFANLNDYISNASGISLGRVTARNYGGSSDAVFCQLTGSNTATNTLVVDGVSNTLSTLISQPGVSTMVNKIGAFSGHTSGRVVGTNVSATDDSGVRFTNLTEIDMYSEAGDSGGIVYSYVGSTNTRLTIGIINGGNGEHAFVSKASEINSALGTNRY